MPGSIPPPTTISCTPDRSASKRVLPPAHRDHAQAWRSGGPRVGHRILHFRVAVCYGLHAPVKVLWEGPRGSRLHGEGMSRGGGVAGAFILIPACTAVGTTLQTGIF